jgi:hypothetical protein
MATKNAAAPTSDRGGQKPAGQRGGTTSKSTTKTPARSTVSTKTIPPEIKALKQWVMWRYEWREENGKGKWTKVPYQCTGRHAQSNNPKTWDTFDRCYTTFKKDKSYSGIGVMFYDGLSGIDFDGHVDEDYNLSPLAQRIITLANTYAEYSPSGKGIHLLCFGQLPIGSRRKDDVGFEMYDTGRFFTVTGDHLPDSPFTVERRDRELAAIHAEIFGSPAASGPAKSAPSSPPVTVSLDDSELINKALSARNGADFSSLWTGDTSKYGGNQSNADQALCNHLAFWTGKDAARMDHLFRQSSLMRDKWDKRHSSDGRTYGQMTIDKAIANTHEVYTPDRQNGSGPDPDATGKAAATAAKPKPERRPPTKSGAYITALADAGYSFRFNELVQDIEVNGAPLTDNLAAEIRCKMRDRNFSDMRAMEDAYTAHALKNAYHPIKEYLSGLKWDGLGHIEQLGTFLVDSHTRFANGDRVAPRLLRRWLIAAVGKVFDQIQAPMLVLEGRQNLGKSHFIAWLASQMPAYFVEGPIAPDDKDCKVRLMSRWLWEVSELGATTRRADVEALKSFVTLRDVTVRRPYGRRDVHGPAVCSLIGTLNDTGAGFLNDTTGSRRFLTLALAELHWDYGKFVDIGQVWAEAVAAYRAGESPYLTPEERDKQAEINAGFTAVDPVEDLITTRFVIDPKRQDWITPSADILRAMDDTLRGTSPGHARSIAAYLKTRGIVSSRPYVGGHQVRGYCGIRPLSETETNKLQLAVREAQLEDPPTDKTDTRRQDG